MEKNYLVYVYSGIEPELKGPYTEFECWKESERMFKEQVKEEDALFWLTIEENGEPSISPFSADFADNAREGGEGPI